MIDFVGYRTGLPAGATTPALDGLRVTMTIVPAPAAALSYYVPVAAVSPMAIPVAEVEALNG